MSENSLFSSNFLWLYVLNAIALFPLSVPFWDAETYGEPSAAHLCVILLVQGMFLLLSPFALYSCLCRIVTAVSEKQIRVVVQGVVVCVLAGVGSYPLFMFIMFLVREGGNVG